MVEWILTGYPPDGEVLRIGFNHRDQEGVSLRGWVAVDGYKEDTQDFLAHPTPRTRYPPPSGHSSSRGGGFQEKTEVDLLANLIKYAVRLLQSSLFSSYPPPSSKDKPNIRYNRAHASGAF